MSQLGERLRQARESKGLSLAEVALETRIRPQSLQALEEGNYHLLPNDVVAKGFVRNYAQELGLPPDELIDLYRAETGGSKPIQVVAATSMRRSNAYVLPSFFGVFFVTIALVALVYVALSAVGYVGNEPVADAVPTPTEPAATPTPLDTPEPVVMPTIELDTTPALAQGAGADDNANEPDVSVAADEEEEAIPEITATSFTIPTVAGVEQPTITPTPTATPQAPIVVQVSILSESIEGSWLRVTTDGAIAYEQIMLPGEQQVFLAQRRIDIRAGNPTDVVVEVNGLQPEVIGQVPGVPTDWSWPPQ